MFKPSGRRIRRGGVVSALVFVAAGATWAGGSQVAVGAAGTGGTTARVSVSSNETQSNGASPSVFPPIAISPNGRFVVFTDSGSLDGVDTNNAQDVFVRDRTLGTTSRVSVSSAEAQGNAASYSGA